jgi:hypothetical protein
MSPYVVGGLIGAGGALVVWALATLREYFVEKHRRQDHERTVLKGALVDYLAALDSLMAEVFEQPSVPVPNVIDQALDSLFKRLGIDWVVIFFVRTLQRIAYGDRPGRLLDRLAEASAHLRLVAPAEILNLMRELEELTGRHRSGDSDWRDEWRGRRDDLRKVARQAVDT